tara:strand:- start:1368 stop:2663 length:1296 start_codon:yes stop_codon:yes gene_type:complete
MVDFTDKATRYTTDRSTNSTLKDDVIVNNEFQDGTISGIANQNKSLSNPNKKDDGITGERFAIIYKSVKLDGLHQVQDPGIVDVVSSQQGQDTDIYVHYGFAAGTTGHVSRDSLTDITKMGRFYELLDMGDSPHSKRDGQDALVEMKGTNHGKIIRFMEQGTSIIVPNTPPGEPPVPAPVKNSSPPPEENLIPEIPVENKTLDDYLQLKSGLLGGLEHEDYALVQTGRKADVGKQNLWKIQLDGVDLLENRWQGDSLVMTNTKQAWEALILMEKYWDRLRVIYRFNKGDMANTDWIPLIDYVSNSYRSTKVNADREGTEASQHRNGVAFDIARPSSRVDNKMWARLFVYAGESAGFKGFGIGNGFCHADTRKQWGSWDYGNNVSSYAPEEFLIKGPPTRVYGELPTKVDNAALTIAWGNENWRKAFTVQPS